MAETTEFCWGELVGTWTQVIARIKQMKKYTKLGVYHEVEQLSEQEARSINSVHAQGSSIINGINDYKNVWRVRFYGPKIKADASKAPIKAAKKTIKVQEIKLTPELKTLLTVKKDVQIPGAPVKSPLSMLSRQEGRIKQNTWDITNTEAGNAKLREQEWEEAAMIGNGSISGSMAGEREYVVIKLYDDDTPTYVTPQVTRAEALSIARSAEAGCVALVARTEEFYDYRKSDLEKAVDRIHQILDHMTEKEKCGYSTTHSELEDLHSAMIQWKSAVDKNPKRT